MPRRIVWTSGTFFIVKDEQAAIVLANDSNFGLGASIFSLGSDFNLPSANLNMDVKLLDGVRMHSRTDLSLTHHNGA